MITKEERLFIDNAISKRLGALPDNISVKDCDGVYVNINGNDYEVGAGNKILYARGITRLLEQLSKGTKEYTLEEKPRFKFCAAFMDLSRNAVLKVDRVKDYITILASYGIDKYMMYMEDVYELEGEPRFGYQRGRYSCKDLQEICAYASNFGIEVIPAIQTLGHMEQFLKWRETAPYRENPQILLCGEDKTYDLIEKMVKTMRKAFNTKTIYVGLDEAVGLGAFAYRRKHGMRDRMEIFLEHISAVEKICKKYDFQPIMASDMYFKFFAKDGSDYGVGTKIPEDFYSKMPDIDLVYWDYCGFKNDYYYHQLDEHKKTGKEVYFMGGNWTWNEILPDFDLTLKTAVPAMGACIDKNIENVILSNWYNDGAETDLFSSTFQLAVLSEACYSKDYSLENIYNMGAFVSGASYEEMRAIDEFTYSHGSAKAMLYGDILLNLTGNFKLFDERIVAWKKALETLENSTNKNEYWVNYFDFVKLLYKICIFKGDILLNIKERYNAKDREYFKDLSINKIPELTEMYRQLRAAWKKVWYYSNKPFGWEVIGGRMGWVIGRLEELMVTCGEFANGKINNIDELEAEFIDIEEFIETQFWRCVSTSVEC